MSTAYTNEVFFNVGTEAIGFARNMKPLADLYRKDHNDDEEMVIKINLIEVG